MNKTKYQILRTQTGITFAVPVFLETSVDELGVMVGFDGDISQVFEFCNFTYTQTGNTVQLYNSVNIEGFKQNVRAVFTIEWGDGTTSDFPIHTGNTLSTIQKTYTNNGKYTITISLLSPWTVEVLSKVVTIPRFTTIPNDVGNFNGFTIPYTNLIGSIDYLNNLDYTNNTGYTNFTYAAIGGSRIIEKKLYGVNQYSGVTIVNTSNNIYSGYTIDGIEYRDYSDGYTMIIGTTSGYSKEEVFNNLITRNEHFIGFIDEPTIYSDIFVERGKQSVMENNFRLNEIDNIGELSIYGNGFYKIQNQ